MRGVVEVILFREAEAHCTRCSDKIERVEGESLQAEKTPLHCVRCCVGKCGGGAGKKKGEGGERRQWVLLRARVPVLACVQQC